MAKAKTEKPSAVEAKVEANGKSGGRPTWKGALQLGPISIPVGLFTAARGERISFNMLHATCKQKVRQAGYYCPCCVEVKVLKPFLFVPTGADPAFAAIELKAGQVLTMHADDANKYALVAKVEPTGQKAMVEDDDQILKGYEVTRNNFVVVTKDEIEAQKPESGATIQIDTFVPQHQVNPIFFETSYYLAADEAVKNKSYSVLREGLIRRKVAAIGKVCIRQSENIVFILPHPDGGLIAYVSYMSDEVRQIKFQAPAAVSEEEAKAVCNFIDAMTDDLDMGQFHDSYRENLLALVSAKAEGKEAPAVLAKPKPVQSDNLLEMLTASTIAARQKKQERKSA